MNEPAALSAESAVEESRRWWIRDATSPDVPEIAGALRMLLTELGGSPPAARELEWAAGAVIDDPERGCLLVADTADDGLVGVLAASWQHAIHVPGRYCILQDLWTDLDWRSRGVGASLVAELLVRMRRHHVDCVEVGLPSGDFARLEATEAFYLANGFASLGPRMRQVLK